MVDPLKILKEKMAALDLKFELKPVTVKSVRKLMGKMKKKKSAGADEINQSKMSTTWFAGEIKLVEAWKSIIIEQ